MCGFALAAAAVRAMSTASSSSSSGGQRNGGRQQRQNASDSTHVPLWRQLLLGGASALALAAVAHDLYNWQSAKACGIVGFIGSEPAVPYLMEGTRCTAPPAPAMQLPLSPVLPAARFAFACATVRSVDSAEPRVRLCRCVDAAPHREGL